jgi:hypothetical protein
VEEVEARKKQAKGQLTSNAIKGGIASVLGSSAAVSAASSALSSAVVAGSAIALPAVVAGGMFFGAVYYIRKAMGKRPLSIDS